MDFQRHGLKKSNPIFLCLNFYQIFWIGAARFYAIKKAPINKNKYKHLQVKNKQTNTTPI